jgi:LPXTG-site transpeptidase (sortase) family protein
MYYTNLNPANPIRTFFVILAVLVCILGLGFLLFFSATSDNFTDSSYPLQEVEASETQEWIPELPVRLVIPAIDVDAQVQYVGLDPDGTGEMDVPSNFTDVGWYKHGVRPGMTGSAVITGHFNGKEVPEGVFYDLSKLQVGDEVVIMSENRIEDIFQVVKIATYAHDDPTEEVFGSPDEKKRLNLITCSGAWLPEQKLYDKRTVVFTELLTDVE